MKNRGLYDSSAGERSVSKNAEVRNMKTLKMGVMLLALLLAAMVMVPMVNAKEQATTVSNTPLPHLQPDNTQQKTVIQNGFTLSKGNNLTDITEGSIIQHSADGSTRVFDSNGKQISVSNDIDSPKIPTPDGYIAADKITQVPNGAFIQDNDNGTTNVYLNNQRILTVLSPAHKTISRTANRITGGWIEDAKASGIPSLAQFMAYWMVPATPSNPQTGATTFIFNGITPSDNRGIVQPVLAYENQHWDAFPYYVDSNGAGYIGAYIYPASQHEILGILEWNTNLNAWDIIVNDENTAGSSSKFSVNAPNIGTTDDTAYCALEAYNYNSNSDIPGTTSFLDMTANNLNYNPISFSWTRDISSNTGLSNLGVSYNGMSYVTLST
jgi:hypothetical protein